MFAALPLAAAAAAASQPQPDQPARWVLDESGINCSLARRLQQDPQITFALRTMVGTGLHEIIVTGLSVARPNDRERQISFAFGPAGRRHEQSAWASIGTVAGRPGVRFSVREDLVAELANATSISLAMGSRTLAEHALPQAAAGARALRGCEARLLTEWGADPAGFEPGAVRPRPGAENHLWISLGALGPTSGDETKIIARLTLGVNGRAENCTLLESVGFASPPAAACAQLIERARYEPARDARGNPVRSVAVYHLAVRRAHFTTTEGAR